MGRLLILIISVLPLTLWGQGANDVNTDNAKSKSTEAAISTPFFSASAGWTFPFGEMGNRYSPFFNINADLGWKTAANWIISVDFCFQFGSNNIKHIKDYLSVMYTDNDREFIIGADGTDGGVVGYNRNLSFALAVGKIIPVFGSNPNSGLEITLSGGWLQHQIIYEATQSKVFQLEGDYKYGYDRQMRGPMAGLFVGYRHISKKTYANWFAGLQWNTAWTKLTRDYLFDLRSGDDKRYTDHMLTLKVGWMFPFFGRSADKIYYF
ncbi:MAG: hypothetical protein J6P44_04820 [Bacteroidales bacterium]|nr:hypothetical protein [Bacteroidales bacterium]